MYVDFLTIIFKIHNSLHMYFICYMAPKTVLILLPTMHSKITCNANTTNNNDVSTTTVYNSGSTATIFDVYQQTLFGLSEISIHTLVSDTTLPFSFSLLDVTVTSVIKPQHSNPWSNIF